MKLKNFLNVMKPTRTYKVICGGTVAEFEPDEALPDIIASAELIKSIKDHAGKAVIKDKNKLSEAMEKLARYEDAEDLITRNYWRKRKEINNNGKDI